LDSVVSLLHSPLSLSRGRIRRIGGNLQKTSERGEKNPELHFNVRGSMKVPGFLLKARNSKGGLADSRQKRGTAFKEGEKK